MQILLLLLSAVYLLLARSGFNWGKKANAFSDGVGSGQVSGTESLEKGANDTAISLSITGSNRSFG